MKLALRELRRRPGRFAVATAILTLIALLLMFLGGLLDGLIASQTGAYRAQQGDLIVYAVTAQESLVRSRIGSDVRTEVENVAEVEEVGGLASVQLGARPADTPETRNLMPTVLFGYESAPRGLPAPPPASGEVIADSALRSYDVEEGDEILLGPERSPVKVVGFVDDTRYAAQISLWGSLETWHSVTDINRPGQFGDDVVQALVIKLADGADDDAVAAAVDQATNGATETLSFAEAIAGLPGVSEQRSTFNQIIAVTVVVALVVVALFFALITVERTGLYGILKAIGASSGTLLIGVVAQAVVVTAVATAIGATGALVLKAVIPAGSIPFDPTPGRLLSSTALMLLAAVVGCGFSLRRVLRVDPASAIGAGS